MNEDTSKKVPYSQDQSWEVSDPEAAQISESELAERRRLRDSVSPAESKEPIAAVFSPKLPPPRQVRDSFLPPRQRVELEDQFPEEKLVINYLQTIAPEIKVIMDLIFQDALDLNLSETLAEEKAQKFVLESLQQYFQERDISTPLIPPHPKIKKAASQALLKAVQMHLSQNEAEDLTMHLILALRAEKSLVHWLDTASPKKRRQQKTVILWKSPEDLNSGEKLVAKAALFGTLLISIFGQDHPMQIPLALALLADFTLSVQKENLSKEWGKQLASAFLYGLKKGLGEMEAGPVVREVIFIANMLKRASFFDSLPIAKLLNEMVTSMEPQESKIDEKAASGIQRDLDLYAPSLQQAHHFVRLFTSEEEGITGIMPSL